MNTNTKLIQRLFDSFVQSASGDTAIRTLSVTAIPVFGQIKITASIQQLPSAGLTNGVILQAKSSNAGSVILGGSGVTTTQDGSGNGFILEAGNSITYACDNLNEIYVIGTLNDVISYAGS